MGLPFRARVAAQKANKAFGNAASGNMPFVTRTISQSTLIIFTSIPCIMALRRRPAIGRIQVSWHGSRRGLTSPSGDRMSCRAFPIGRSCTSSQGPPADVGLASARPNLPIGGGAAHVGSREGLDPTYHYQPRDLSPFDLSAGTHVGDQRADRIEADP